MLSELLCVLGEIRSRIPSYISDGNIYCGQFCIRTGFVRLLRFYPHSILLQVKIN